ncbi:MAG TPA: ROK family protein [Gemmataceae bacterium]|nr:ROK family protein [Gemmataceae bacterium]
MYLGIEIGGTKLQLGLGTGDGVLPKSHLWRDTIIPVEGGEGIRRRIEVGLPQLLSQSGVDRGALRGVGIGFGGPVDDATRTVIKSHHIAGWDGFPLADWVADLVGVPSVLGNDADVAGLAEALYGAGKGLSPIFYITVGTGVGGGLIIDGEIYRGVGKGAAEIGHVRPAFPLDDPRRGDILEMFAAGHGLEKAAATRGLPITGKEIGLRAVQDDPECADLLDRATQALAENICTVIKLLCPRRVIIGGGVSLIGEEWFFAPIRRYVAERGMTALAGLTDIVPAALGEEVVVHGALALARKKFG